MNTESAVLDILRNPRPGSKTGEMISWLEKEAQMGLTGIHVSTSLKTMRANVHEMNLDELREYIEGYAKEFMDLVGAREIPDFQLF